MKTIGVVGAGVMGVGVALCAAQAGFDVVLVDVNDTILARARAEIRNHLRFQAVVGNGMARPDIEGTLERIEFASTPNPLARADLVVENVVEKWEVKREAYICMRDVCPEHCIFAANTSAVSITRIAALTRRASAVLGMHFMNPVPMKDTVEVIRGFRTSEETIAKACEFLGRMGKRAIVVNDSPGFVSNRVLMLTINEAINLVQERVASAENIDAIFESCFGHKMGPLATADLIGLDTILMSLEVLQSSFGDSKFCPSILLRQMVDAGLHGRKTGKGFFEYDIDATDLSPLFSK